jgi:hypothetical protein
MIADFETITRDSGREVGNGECDFGCIVVPAGVLTFSPESRSPVSGREVELSRDLAGLKGNA